MSTPGDPSTGLSAHRRPSGGEGPAPGAAPGAGPGVREYVLGTGEDELTRLGLQHRLWADAAHEAWKAAGVKLGDAVLDLGAGPGFASFDLAGLVGPRGLVLALDESPVFIEHLTRQAAARGLGQLRGVVGDVHAAARVVGGAGGAVGAVGVGAVAPGDAPSARGGFDIVYARWVLCFVKDPAGVVGQCAAALKPGGRLVVHDYFNYTCMTAAPKRPFFTAAVLATDRSWRDHGGDPDIAGRLPAMASSHGLRLTHHRVHQRLARGGETMFQWPDLWWRTYAPKLVSMGYLTPPQAEGLLAEMAQIAADPAQFIHLPPVYEQVYVKA